MSVVRGGVAICTAITANFAAFARVWARSIRDAGHRDPLFAIVTERSSALGDWNEPLFTSVPIEACGLPDLTRQTFINPPHELTVLAAAGPPLRAGAGFDTAIFLDSDVWVLDDLALLVETAAAHAITLSPHLLAPLRGSDRAARELTMLRSGTFNGGAVAVSNRPEGHRFLEWWLGRLSTHNRMAPGAGMHHDQRWLDLAPGFFERCGCRARRGVQRGTGIFPSAASTSGRAGRRSPEARAGSCTLSGFDPARPEVLSRHTTRVTRETLGEAALLLDAYASALAEAGHDLARTTPFSYAAFDNGIPIPLQARETYRDLGQTSARFGDPFATGPGCFLEWLLSASDEPGPGRGLPRLWRAVYDRRPDLQQAFADPAGVDRSGFVRWVRASGLQEHAIDPALAMDEGAATPPA
ncbi:MAG: hypothetical protein R2712_22305 [Vicinamibacterales bacterium]